MPVRSASRRMLEVSRAVSLPWAKLSLVFHGSDVGYLLGLFPTYGVNHTAHEEAFIREFQTYWSVLMHCLVKVQLRTG